ncbi:MAG: tetratricopeptide repeat protein [Myxococcales bacterium]|nr:tetratricopeptide repeat protein [Myxococcales bacterium]
MNVRTLPRAALVCAALAATTVISPRFAQGQTTAETEEDAAIREGVALRRAGRDADAVVVFERAYARWRSARAAGQLGLCEQALGRWVIAERHVRDALADTGDAWVQRNRATLEGALRVAEQHLATVEIVGGVEGAELFIDGERAGVIPANRSIRVVSGSARIEHRVAGSAPVVRVVELAAGTIERVSFPTQVASSQTQQINTQGGSQGAVAIDNRDPRPVTVAPTRIHPLVWAGAASLGAGLATTIAGFAVGSGIEGAYRRECVERIADPSCVDRRAREQGTLDALSVVTGVGWTLIGLGAVGGGVGAALTITGRGERRVSVVPMANGVVVTGRF